MIEDIKLGWLGLNVIWLIVVLLKCIKSCECFLINVWEFVILMVSDVFVILWIEVSGMVMLKVLDFFCILIIFFLL